MSVYDDKVAKIAQIADDDEYALTVAKGFSPEYNPQMRAQLQVAVRDAIERGRKKTIPLKLRMQYIGACALLGRLSNRIQRRDDLDAIKRALDNCAATFPDNLEVIKTGNGQSYSLEPIQQPQDNLS